MNNYTDWSLKNHTDNLQQAKQTKRKTSSRNRFALSGIQRDFLGGIFSGGIFSGGIFSERNFIRLLSHHIANLLEGVVSLVTSSSDLPKA